MRSHDTHNVNNRLIQFMFRVALILLVLQPIVVGSETT